MLIIEEGGKPENPEKGREPTTNSTHIWRQACVSQKTRKPFGPESFSGLFSGNFLGFRKAFLKAPEISPDSIRKFRDFLSGRVAPLGFAGVGHDFAARASKRILECFGLSLWLFRGIFFTFKLKTVRIWYIDEVLWRLKPHGVFRGDGCELLNEEQHDIYKLTPYASVWRDFFRNDDPRFYY